MSWASATNGWGPVEPDRSNGEKAAGDGHTLTINGTTYAKGLGTHAASDVTYYLGGTCSRLTVNVGVDDEAGGTNGSVVFRLYRDDTLVADSGRMTGADAAKSLSADLTGGIELRLAATDSGDGLNYDHADWATPQLTCA
nr:NPCBM/NEW2 domain-containing protein [Streptomyces olivochromogenes]